MELRLVSVMLTTLLKCWRQTYDVCLFRWGNRSPTSVSNIDVVLEFQKWHTRWSIYGPFDMLYTIWPILTMTVWSLMNVWGLDKRLVYFFRSTYAFWFIVKTWTDFVSTLSFVVLACPVTLTSVRWYPSGVLRILNSSGIWLDNEKIFGWFLSKD